MKAALLLGILLGAIALVLLRGRGSGHRRSPEIIPKERTIVWLMHSYVPNVRAGAEITVHALNQQLVRSGWRVIVVLPDYQVPIIDGVECYKFPKSGRLADADESLVAIMRSAAVFFCQNYDALKAIDILEPFGRPIVFFLHIDREKPEILQQRFSVPVAVVYNSLTQREQNPTIHESAIVRPYVPYGDFRRRGRHVVDGPVTLLNCNRNKGGHMLPELARRMRDVTFLGVRGAYDTQISEDLPNLSYVPLQEDPRPIYEKAGIIIMPSKSESWGRVALEAMASGVPVIVSTTHGLREATGGQAAAYCRPDDVGCFEAAIRRLRGDGQHYGEAVQKADSHIEKMGALDDFQLFETWLVEQLNDWSPSTNSLPS